MFIQYKKNVCMYLATKQNNPLPARLSVPIDRASRFSRSILTQKPTGKKENEIMGFESWSHGWVDRRTKPNSKLTRPLLLFFSMQINDFKPFLLLS